MNANSDEFSFDSVVSEPPLNCIDIHHENLRETYYRIPILFFVSVQMKLYFVTQLLKRTNGVLYQLRAPQISPHP